PIVKGGDGIDLDLVGHVLDAGIVINQGQGGVSGKEGQGVAAEGDSAILYGDGNGVEGVAVKDTIIGELIGELCPEHLVGNGGTADFYQVAHRGDAIGLRTRFSASTLCQ